MCSRSPQAHTQFSGNIWKQQWHDAQFLSPYFCLAGTWMHKVTGQLKAGWMHVQFKTETRVAKVTLEKLFSCRLSSWFFFYWSMYNYFMLLKRQLYNGSHDTCDVRKKMAIMDNIIIAISLLLLPHKIGDWLDGAYHVSISGHSLYGVFDNHYCWDEFKWTILFLSNGQVVLFKVGVTFIPNHVSPVFSKGHHYFRIKNPWEFEKKVFYEHIMVKIGSCSRIRLKVLKQMLNFNSIQEHWGDGADLL